MLLLLLPRLPRLSLPSKNPNFPALNLIRALARSYSSMAPPSEVLAEYAKSGRSSCKGCGEAIKAGSLRLGLSSKDPRGWDSVKWHHMDCFLSQPEPLGAAEEIKGFSSLKDCDREALKKLEASALANQSDKELSQTGKVKGVETNLYASVVKDNCKVTAEYAKSSRSSCKSCGEVIKAGSLRLGLSSKDPRGFDFVKWHHLACLPAGTMPLCFTEEIDGFSSLKNCDQEALLKLEAAASPDQPNNEDHTRHENTEIEKSDGRSSKKPKIDSGDDVGNGESKDKSSEELKLSQPGKEIGLEVDFSVADVKDKYKDATLSPNWKAFNTIIFRERVDDLHDSEKIAAFDFDGCLVNTSVRRTGPDAWSLLYPSIPEKLQGLHNSGYKLVIFTNESNIERWKNKRQQAVDSKIGRLDNFIKIVKVPIQVFIACGLGKSKDQIDDPCRKPKTGMWRIMERHFNSGISINMEQSFYVGDAAGRVNDHSDADIKFAKAIGLKFYVPEEFFGVAKAPQS